MDITDGHRARTTHLSCVGYSDEIQDRGVGSGYEQVSI